jgi:hypothetical protein
MRNFNRRIERIADKLGINREQERYVVILTTADPDPEPFPEDSSFKKHEIVPGVLALVWGEPLTSDEREELRAKYAAERANRPEET